MLSLGNPKAQEQGEVFGGMLTKFRAPTDVKASSGSNERDAGKAKSGLSQEINTGKVSRDIQSPVKKDPKSPVTESISSVDYELSEGEVVATKYTDNDAEKLGLLDPNLAVATLITPMVQSNQVDLPYSGTSVLERDDSEQQDSLLFANSSEGSLDANILLNGKGIEVVEGKVNLNDFAMQTETKAEEVAELGTDHGGSKVKFTQTSEEETTEDSDDVVVEENIKLVDASGNAGRSINSDMAELSAESGVAPVVFHQQEVVRTDKTEVKQSLAAVEASSEDLISNTAESSENRGGDMLSNSEQKEVDFKPKITPEKFDLIQPENPMLDLPEDTETVSSKSMEVDRMTSAPNNHFDKVDVVSTNEIKSSSSESTKMHVREQVMVKISELVGHKDKTMTIQLNPHDLGMVEVKLVYNGNVKEIEINATNREAYMALKEHEAALKAELEKVTGSEEASLSFNLSDSNQNQQEQQKDNFKYQSFESKTQVAESLPSGYNYGSAQRTNGQQGLNLVV